MPHERNSIKLNIFDALLPWSNFARFLTKQPTTSHSNAIGMHSRTIMPMTRKWILNLVRVYVQMNKIVVQWKARTHLSAELNTYPSNLLATFYGGGLFPDCTTVHLYGPYKKNILIRDDSNYLPFPHIKWRRKPLRCSSCIKFERIKNDDFAKRRAKL